jgi:transposase InsO family protein
MPHSANLFAYIEGYYNRRRRHSAIGYITPEQAEANPRNSVPTFQGEGQSDAPATIWKA